MRRLLFSVIATLLMIFSAISISVPFISLEASAQGLNSITIDGSPNDWTGELPSTPNTAWISNGELVVRDAIGDERTNFSNPDPRVDIVQFRMTYDSEYYYFMVQFANMNSFKIGDDGATFLDIAIGDGSSGTKYLAGSSDTTTAYPIKYNIVVNLACSEYSGSNKTSLVATPDKNWGAIFYIVNSSWQFLQPSGAKMGVNITQNTIEIRIPRDMLSGTELNITVASARGWSHYSSDEGGTWDISGESDILDTINNTGIQNENTWNDVKDGKIDQYITVALQGTPGVIKARNITRISATLYWYLKDENQDGIEVPVPILATSWVKVATDPNFQHIVQEFNTTCNYTTLQNLSPGTEYWVEISTDGGKTWSKPYSFTTSSAPVPPSNLKIEDVTSTSVLACWKSSPDAVKYEVKVTSSNGTVVYLGNTTKTSIEITGLEPGTKYTVQVRTVASDGTTSVWISGNFWTIISLPSVSSQENYTWREHEGELCWKDKAGDEIATGYNGQPINGSAADILAVYVTERNDYLYVVYKMKNILIGEDGATGIVFTIDTDHVCGKGIKWVPGEAGVNVTPEAYWEYAVRVSLNFIHSYGSPFYGSNPKGSWNVPLLIIGPKGAPINSPNSYLVVSNETKVIEVAISLKDIPSLASPSGGFLRMTFGAGKVNGANGNFWQVYIPGGKHPGLMDVVSTESPSKELEDFTINYYSDITLLGFPPHVGEKTVTRVSAEFNWSMAIYSSEYLWELSKSSSFSTILSQGDTSLYNVTVQGLEPQTTYYFRVSADGGKTWSNVIEFTTLPAPPPPKVAIVSLGRTNVTFSWNQVEPGAKYNIKLVERSNGKLMFEKNGYSGTEIKLTGLSPNTSYTFEIMTCASDGTHSAWAYYNFTTLPPPSPPSSVWATDAGKTYVSVSWSAVQEAGIRYDVRICEEQNPENWIQEQNGIQSTSATFFDLQPHHAYYIFVRANATDGTKSSWKCLEVYTLSFSIDGNGKDWNITPPSTPNTWTYEHGILVFNDSIGDVRHDYNVNGHVPPDLDIQYVAIYSDEHYAYFLIKLVNITKVGKYVNQNENYWWKQSQGLGLIIGISYQNSSGTIWLPNYIGAVYPVKVQRQIMIVLSNPGWNYNATKVHGNYAELTVYNETWQDVGSWLSMFVANASTGEIEVVVPLSTLGISSLDGAKIFVATGVYDWYAGKFLTFGGTGVMDTISFLPGNTWNEISNKIDDNYALHSSLVYKGTVETYQAWGALNGTEIEVNGTVYAKNATSLFIEGKFLGDYYGVEVRCKNTENYSVGEVVNAYGKISRDAFGNLILEASSVEKVGTSSIKYPMKTISEMASEEFHLGPVKLEGAYVEEFRYYSSNGTNYLVLSQNGTKIVAEYYGKDIGITLGFVLNVYGVEVSTAFGKELILAKPEIVKLAPPKVKIQRISNGIKVSWTKVPMASYYVAQISTDMNFTHILYSAKTPSTSWIIGAPPNGTYYARVKAVSSTGVESPWGVSFSLSPPRILKVEVSSNQVYVEWSKVPLADVYYYEISLERSFSKVITSGETSSNYVVISNLNPYTKYYFRICAKNETYGITSSWTLSSFTTKKPYLEEPIIYGKAINETEVQIWWDPVEYADYYEVAWSENSTLPPGPYKIVNGTTIKVTGLKPATTYYFFVRAVSKKYSEVSGWSSINVMTKKPSKIASPKIKIVSVGDTWVKVSVYGVQEADHYEVQASIRKDFTSILKDVVSTSSTINLTSLQPYTTYYLRAFAINETYGLRSDPSKIVEVTTLKPPLSPPEVKIASIGSTYVKIRIFPVKYAEEYRISLWRGEEKILERNYTTTIVYISGLTPNTSYLVEVVAVSLRYSEESLPTKLSFKTGRFYLEEPVAKIISIGMDYVKISWNPVKGADEYVVEVSLYKDFWTLEKSYTIKGTEINITGLLPSMEYYIGIIAYNETYRASSSMKVLEVQTSTYFALEPPNNISVALISHNEIKISWSPVKGATYYIVEISTNPSFNSSKCYGTMNNAIHIIDLSQDQTYYVRIKAKSPYAESPWSYIVKFEIPPLQKTTIKAYCIVGQGNVTLYLGGSDIFYVEVRDYKGSLVYTIGSSGNLTIFFYSAGNYTIIVYGFNGQKWTEKVFNVYIATPSKEKKIPERSMNNVLAEIDERILRFFRHLARFWTLPRLSKLTAILHSF